jgi:hypothetical protein
MMDNSLDSTSPVWAAAGAVGLNSHRHVEYGCDTSLLRPR